MSETKLAFLFPGQGSQAVGMGRDLSEKFAVAKQTFEEADEALGFSLSKLCFDGPEEQLRLTEFTQPAIFTVSIAAQRVLAERGISRLMVEGGPTVAAAFVQADLVDEAALFRSPNALGEGIEALEGLPLTALTKSPALKPLLTEQVGGDTLELFTRS